MEARVLRESYTEMELELVGEDHTFCNALREALSSNDKVIAASYRVEHPLLGNPKLYLKTKRIKVPKKEKVVPLRKVKGIGAVREKQLQEAGISSANALLKADVVELQEKTGLPMKVLEGYVEEAKKLDYGRETAARYVLKESLAELGKIFSELKAKFDEAV
jgi:DNA-directed RNA polymerase subunit L